MTARTPPRIDVGLSQLLNVPPGTRPDAMPPATVPRKNGVTTDELAKDALASADEPALRKANPDPRSTMPSAARPGGTNNVVMIADNADGNPVHRTTRHRISHTWLASHTGPRDASIKARTSRRDPAVRSQNPAPKSAPPNTP